MSTRGRRGRGRGRGGTAGSRKIGGRGGKRTLASATSSEALSTYLQKSQGSLSAANEQKLFPRFPCGPMSISEEHESFGLEQKPYLPPPPSLNPHLDAQVQRAARMRSLYPRLQEYIDRKDELEGFEQLANMLPKKISARGRAKEIESTIERLMNPDLDDDNEEDEGEPLDEDTEMKDVRGFEAGEPEVNDDDEVDDVMDFEKFEDGEGDKSSGDEAEAEVIF